MYCLGLNHIGEHIQLGTYITCYVTDAIVVANLPRFIQPPNKRRKTMGVKKTSHERRLCEYTQGNISTYSATGHLNVSTSLEGVELGPYSPIYFLKMMISYE